MGFASGFQSGQNAVKSLSDTYEKTKEKNELQKIASQQAVASNGFTAEQGKELEQLSQQGYTIEFDSGKNAYVAKNEGGDTKVIGMQRVTDFMGNRTAGDLSVEQQNADKNMAMADVVSQRDPLRGQYLRTQARNDAHNAKRMQREEKQWGNEDRRASIDAELGKEIEASLMGADGKARAPTVDDYLGNIQKKALRYIKEGFSKEAGEAMREHHAAAYSKIQLQAAERKEDLGRAMAALQSGNLSVVADYYNKHVPSGAKITQVQQTKDGGYVMSRVGMDGQELPPLSVATFRDAAASLSATNDPSVVYQHSQNEFNNQLKLRSETRADRADARAERADGRSAAAHATSQANARRAESERQERRNVLGALAQEQDPNLSATHRRAIELGVVDMPGKGGAYSYDPGKIQKTFGETSVDPLTGKETIKRNMQREGEFAQFLADNPQIRNDDEALMKFGQQSVARQRQQAVAQEQRKQADASINAQDFVDTVKQRGITPAEVAERLVSEGRMDEKRAKALADEAKKLLKNEKKDAPKEAKERPKADAEKAADSAARYSEFLKNNQARPQRAPAVDDPEAREREQQARMMGIGNAFQEAYRR